MLYQFQGQHQNEEVLLISRQHPFVLLKPFLFAALVALIPFAANIIFDFSTILAIILIASWLVAGMLVVMAYHAWLNSTMLLTDERIVLARQTNFLNRDFTECALVNIQQVTHKIKGLLPTLLGYGDISIYTAGGAQAIFLIPNIPDPYVLQQEILKVAIGE